MEKQTAIEWLFEQFEFGDSISSEDIILFKQAKEIEKAQIIEFADEYNFQFMAGNNKSVGEFFNEQFKN